MHRFSSTPTGLLVVYVGHNPQEIETTHETTKTNLIVGDRKVTFLKTPTKNGYKLEAVIDDFFKGFSGDGVPELKLQIVIIVSDQDVPKCVQQGLKTLRPRTIANKVPEDTADKLADPQRYR